MKIGLVLKELHRAENDLAHELLQIADRHQVDHEIYHVARDLAGWSQQHVRDLVPAAERYGQSLSDEPEGEAQLAKKLLDKGSQMVGRMKTPGLLLLHDLRQAHMKTAGVGQDWQMLAQAAQGVKDAELLELATGCRARNQRQLAWSSAKLKEESTQILLS